MIYEYDTRTMVEFSNGKRASYSKNRYGTLLNKVVNLSVSIDEKVWNYFEHEKEITKLHYYDQSAQKEVAFIVDREDFRKVKNKYWTLSTNGYPFSRQGGKRTFLHNLILDFDKSSDVTDHKNRNKLDNRKSNLHRASYNYNSYNSNKQSNNTSGVTGVDKHRNRWRARIQYKETSKVKMFDNFEEAKQCRLNWENELAVKFNDYHESE